MAAPSTAPKNFARGVLLLSDGTGTPVTLVIPMAQGDFTLGPISQYLNEPVIYTARTRIIGLGWGAPAQPAISLTAMVGNLVGSSNTAPGTVLEFITGKGAYAANISTLGANRPMTVDLRMTIEGTDFGDTADETIDCEDVQMTIEFSEAAEGNSISISGTVLGALVFTNSTNIITISAF
jgi:hypothetical protein